MAWEWVKFTAQQDKCFHHESWDKLFYVRLEIAYLARHNY